MTSKSYPAEPISYADMPAPATDLVRSWPPHHVRLKQLFYDLYETEEELATMAAELFAVTGQTSSDLAEARHLIRRTRESLLINWEPQ